MNMTEKLGLCESCRELKEVAYTDAVERQYCASCFPSLSTPSPYRMLEFLLATIPFKIGDKVACYTAGALYDGTGIIDDISMDPTTFGTPIYPSFHVKIEDKAYPEAPDELWYTESCLKKVDNE